MEKSNSTIPPKTCLKAYVIDASAIFNGILSHHLHGEKYIPECVIDEIHGMYRGEVFIEDVKINREVRITIPNQSSLNEIISLAKKTGDIQELSPCDLSVLALALQLKSEGFSIEILTDDYDIQNLASHCQIPCNGIYWSGIKWAHNYIWICSGCNIESKTHQEVCIICGSPMIKRLFSKKRIKSQRK